MTVAHQAELVGYDQSIGAGDEWALESGSLDDLLLLCAITFTDPWAEHAVAM